MGLTNSAIMCDGPDSMWARYVNYAYGDEPLRSVYGESLDRLVKLKR